MVVDTRSSRFNRPTRVTREPPTVEQLVLELAATLLHAGVQHPRQEARDIVAAVAGEGRFWPNLNGNARAGANLIRLSRKAAKLRTRGAPFAYCVGRAAFRHLTLAVDDRVLIPRQETEQLVELVLRNTRGEKGCIAVDVGTGSGAIAIALASEGKGRFQRIIATDVSRGALRVAERNAAASIPRGGCTVDFICCDMLSAVPESAVRVVVSNPPYIAFEEARSLPESVRNWEPPEALYSAGSGLTATARLINQSAQLLASGGLMALEVDARRASLVAELVLSHGLFHDVRVELDLAGRERFVLATKEN